MINILKSSNCRKVLLMLFALILIPCNVKADSITVTGGDYVTFSNYGINTGTSHIRSSYKTTSDGKEVYCVMFTKDFSNGTFTNCTKKMNLSTTKQRVAGEIIELVDTKYVDTWDKNKRYAYKVAALNTYLGLSGSSNFSGGSPSVASIISSAKENYNKFKENKVYFSKLTISGGGVLNDTKTANVYISNAVTFEGLMKTVEGATPNYTFSVSGLKSGQTAYLCTGSSGTGCSAFPQTISNVTSKTYFIKVTGATEDTNFTVKISGTVSPKYSKGAVYCSSNQQTLLVKASGSTSWSTSKSVGFSIVPTSTTPDTTTHRIIVAKIDENGDPVTGATFEYTDPKPLTLSCSASGAFYNCSYGPVNVTADQFYGKQYCFKETKAPVGFVLPTGDAATTCYQAPTTANSSEICYHNVEDSAVRENDANYCNSNIKSICKKIKTYYKEVEETVPAEEEGGEPTTTTKWVVDDSKAVENTYRLKGDVSCNSTDTTEEPTTETPYKYTSDEVCGIFKGETTAPDVKDNKYCEKSEEYDSVKMNNGVLYVTNTNKKNSVTISKKAATGDDEVPGAELKICTEAGYTEKKDECTAAKTVNDTELSWTSTDNPMEFSGIKPGTYYIVETLPPAGYKLVKTATQFSIDEYGVVKTGTKTATDNTVVVHNQINTVTISKTDMATTKELPGAKMAICTIVDTTPNDSDDTPTEPDSGGTDGENTSAETKTESDDGKPKLNLDMDGKCIPARLADGTDATWTSGKEPKVIEGLPAGTYYLVETTAPFGYSTSESILFTMKEDGTLTDKDGKSLANSKLEMKDAPIKDVKTGMLPIIIISILAIGSIGGAAYFFHKSSYNNNLPRRRKKAYNN